MILFIKNCLVFMGIFILIGSFLPIRRLTQQLAKGRLRHNWFILIALLLFFIFGYIGYITVYWGRAISFPDLLVHLMFFLGACFVLVVTTLSLQTAIDIKRLTILEQENITDHLMGIYNRRYLERRIEEEFSKARRYKTSLSVMILDIDHFKQINDVYGHQVGDIVLKKLGNIILGCIRKADIVARYGGDEIFVIAPNTTASYIVNLAERIRRYMETNDILSVEENVNGQSILVTVSVGIAEMSKEMNDHKVLVERADSALYRAKQKGRNRVVVNHWEAPVTPAK